MAATKLIPVDNVVCGREAQQAIKVPCSLFGCPSANPAFGKPQTLLPSNGTWASGGEASPMPVRHTPRFPGKNLNPTR